MIDAHTELVIEAFPRSANTFATVAFQLSQPAPVRVAHHLHAPAQIIEAARRGIPALVPVRHPRDASISQVIRTPSISLERVLAAYARFHTSLLPYRDGFLAVPFEDITGDYGAVLEHLNRRFATDFGVFEHTPESVNEVYRMIDERARLPEAAADVAAYRSGRLTRGELEHTLSRLSAASTSAVPAALVARPTGERRQRQVALRERYESDPLQAARGAAEAAYAAIVADG